MKKIIPFKKDLIFKTKISEITSISLEHNLKFVENDEVTGEFIITGDYKMTEASVNRELFDFKLPFDIVLDNRYNIDNIVIDIEDFYYEIIDDEILRVNIDVFVDGEIVYEDVKIVEEELENNIIHEKNEIVEEIEEENRDVNIDLNIPELNIFDNIDNSETYVTYHVYIMKEEDTIESIITKYNVSKEELANYNNLENINVGDKIIIPTTTNE